MGTFDGFHPQVTHTFFFVDSCIPAVGEGARTAVAQAGHILRVLAKILGLGLDLVRTKALVDNLPDYFVVLHLVERARPPKEKIFHSKTWTVGKRTKIVRTRQ